VNYNWSNNFKNENKSITATAMTVGSSSMQFMTLDDHLYFENSAIDLQQQIVTLNQYGNTINYVSVKVSKEIKFEILPDTYLLVSK
jgi:hypothetical protein